MDRIEYLMRLTQDHCEDGDEIANRQQRERTAHIQRGEQLLRIAEGLVELLKRDNVVSREAEEEGRTLAALGIDPASIEAVVPTYLRDRS